MLQRVRSPDLLSAASFALSFSLAADELSLFFIFSLGGPCQDGSLPAAFQLVLAERYPPAANCVKEEAAGVAALLQLVPGLFRGAALHNGVDGSKNKTPRYGIAQRVTRPLIAMREMLMVPERLRANPDWSK